MNIAIVDDLAAERKALADILSDYASIHGIPLSLREFSCGEEFLSDYHPLQYTAVFLDIYMEGMTGIQTAEAIRKKDADTLLLFLTTSMDHMQNAFLIHAYDYVEKPATKERLFQIMDDILRKETTDLTLRISFTYNKVNYSLPITKILSVCTAESNYLNIVDIDGKSYHPRMTFGTISSLLENENRFLLINRGIFVNMDFIDYFENGICYMNNGLSYNVYTKRAKETEQIYQNYIFSTLRNVRHRRLKE